MRSFAVYFSAMVWGTAFLSGETSLLIALEPAYEQAPIYYSESQPNTKFTKIADRIAAGEKLLDGETDQEVLRKLLDLLDIPIESQVLVYSKTSAQNSLISPERPRAIYFSDDTYVGWVQHGDIEIISFDEKLGMVFHRMKIPNNATEKPISVNRDQSCLSCHGGTHTGDWPGLIVRSVYPQQSGQPLFQAGTFKTDHGSPLSERWGGWYVTGDSEGQEHLGNIIAQEDQESGKVTFQKTLLGSVSNLAGHIPVGAYLAGGTSDIVALMILEHQLSVHNALVRGNLITRQTLHQHRAMRLALQEDPEAPLSETNRGIIQNQALRIVQALFFTDEFPMKDTGVEGSRSFQLAFAKNAKKDSAHRSLKELRLYERLMKYRCSYLIYSEAFQHLPPAIKHPVIQLMREVLDGSNTDQEFSHLTDSEKQRIDQILTETWPDWQVKS